jgi:hypothetical protein
MIRDWTKRRVVPLSIWLASAALAGGCREAQVKSVWRDREIAVDGLRSDWQGIDVYNFGDKDVLLGVANDSESLYLLLVTSNRTLGMQSLTEGLTASFRVGAEGSDLLSVCYAPQRRGGPERDGQGPGGPGDPPEGSSGRVDRWDQRRRGPGVEQGIQQILNRPHAEILILGSAGRDTLRLEFEEAARRGIEERVGYKDGYFALELKVPLRKDASHPHAVGLASGTPEQAAGDAAVELSLHIPKRKGGSLAPEGFRDHGGGRTGPHDDGDEDPDDSGFPGRGGRSGRPGDGAEERRPPSTSGGTANGLELKLGVLLATSPSSPSGQ